MRESDTLSVQTVSYSNRKLYSNTVGFVALEHIHVDMCDIEVYNMTGRTTSA